MTLLALVAAVLASGCSGTGSTTGTTTGSAAAPGSFPRPSGTGTTTSGTAPDPGPWVDSLVNIGDMTIHVSCKGQSSSKAKTVVFVSGLGEDATTAWLASGVPDAVARSGRACVYDRPGLGTSSPATSSRTVDAHVNELAALLDQGAFAAPIVLVGQGFGTFIARQFAKQHVKDVDGMVLVDPPLEVLDPTPPPDASPGQQAEYAAIPDFDANLGAFGAGALPPPPAPTIVLGADDQPPLPAAVPAGGPTTLAPPAPVAGANRRDEQAQLAKKSPFGSFEEVVGSGSYIQYWNPVTVANAIRKVLADPRAPR